jgi:ankyrin repeat protein
MGNVFGGSQQPAGAPLVQPCLLKDLAGVTALLSGGANVAAQDAAGNHALGAAACGGDLQVVELLLQQTGVDAILNLPNGMGLTPVWLAAGYGHLPVLEALLAKGGDPLVPGSTGDTALLAAASKGHANAVGALLDASSNMASVNEGGDTALSVASANGFADVLEKLLSRVEAQRCEAIVNQANSRGIVPIQAASSNGSEECTRLLLDHGADHNARDKNGASAAMVAAFCGNDGALGVLLKHPSCTGLDLEATDEAGATALWTASAGGNAKAAQLLLERGASTEASCGGLTCGQVAAKNGHLPVCSIFGM